MRLLYISEFFEEVSGANKLSVSHFNTLQRIVGNEHFYFVALSVSEKRENNKEKYFERKKTRKEKLLNILELNSVKMDNEIINQICEWIESESIDVVFIDNSIYGNLVKKIKTRFNDKVRIISFYIDVKRNLYSDWLKEQGLKFLPWYLVGVYGEYINQLYSDYNITLNSRESVLFRKYYRREPSLELPIIVKDPIINVIPKSTKKNEVLQILFVGAYYYPNVRGIQWFVKNVMSKIDNSYHLTIIGRDMEILKEDLEECSDNVTVVGAVDDLSIYYSSCDVIVAPIFEGAGMKVKTAEALSYGKIFIGSSESLEGYSANIGSELINDTVFCCNSEDQFIHALEELKRKTRTDFVSENYEIYKKFYSEEAAYNILKDIILFNVD